MTTIITAKEAAVLGLGAAPKTHKYRAERFSLDGIRFDSKAEANCWARLKIMERAGEISGLERQTAFPFVVNGETVFTYRADFTYRDRDGRRHAIDVKGYDTPMSKLKRRIIEAARDITIEVVR